MQALMYSCGAVRLAVVASPTLTSGQFRAWLKQAAPGDRVIYHRGHLAVDRARGLSRLSKASHRELVAVADLALAFAEQGQIQLVQRRHGDSDYSYEAIMTSRRSFAAHRCISAAR